MRQGPHRFAELRHAAFLALAAVAIALKVLVPPGFMISAQGDHTVPVVLCTAYGAKVVHMAADQAPPGDHDDGDQPGGGHDAPCAFPGHAATPTQPLAAPFVYPPQVARAAVRTVAVPVAPGRGLAAPPPPAQAPPRQI